MPENIETKVAQTILQQPEEITVGDKVYKAAPPSAATLILASEAVARMPKIQLNTERIVDEVLAIGKDCRPMGEIVAIMILGAKGLTETRKTIKPMAGDSRNDQERIKARPYRKGKRVCRRWKRCG